MSLTTSRVEVFKHVPIFNQVPKKHLGIHRVGLTCINPNYDPQDPESSKDIIEYQYYVYDDKNHDNLFVQHWLNCIGNGY